MYFDFISNIWNVRLTLVLSNSKRKGKKELWAKINTTTTTTTCLGNICERGKNKQIASSHNRILRKLYKHKFINISYNLSIDGSRLLSTNQNQKIRFVLLNVKDWKVKESIFKLPWLKKSPSLLPPRKVLILEEKWANYNQIPQLTTHFTRRERGFFNFPSNRAFDFQLDLTLYVGKCSPRRTFGGDEKRTQRAEELRHIVT